VFLLDLQPSTPLLDMIEAIPKTFEKTVSSKGRWLVIVSTGSQNDAGTKERVCIVMCGLKGESEPVCVNNKDDLNPNSIRRLEVIIMSHSIKKYMPVSPRKLDNCLINKLYTPT